MSTASFDVRLAIRDLRGFLAPVRAAKHTHRARTRARKTAYHHRRRNR